jgi:phosphomannomutase
VEFDELDGMTVTHQGDPMWWFNLRASNTEPLLRLNVEAADEPTMPRVRDDVLSIVRAEKVTEELRPAGAAVPPGPSVPAIEPWLREILRCPQCQSTLSDGSGPDGPELHCTNTQCRRAYRIDDGIPVLLVDESRVLTD